MIQPIHHTFGPHVTFGYWTQSVRVLFQPWKWRTGKAREQLRIALQEHFEGNAYMFGSGRESLLALFRSLKFESGAEIIIQGYTCIALPNAIHAAGCTVVYADCSLENLNMDVAAVERAITTRTRAILCQHTFGIPAEITKLRALCTEKNLILIEDLAHSIPEQKTLGMFGDYVMVSFGRDKAISGVTGGALIARTTAKDSTLKIEEDQATDLPISVIARLLLYPATYYKSRLLYGLFSLGKAILKLAKMGKLLIPILSTEEKRGYMSPQLTKMPNACAMLALWEWKRLAKINTHRRELTQFYIEESTKHGWKFPSTIIEELPLQKFPILLRNADAYREALKEQLIFLEDGWTGTAVCPRTVDHTVTDYTEGSCPNAERIAQEVLSFPTHPTMTKKRAERLIQSLAGLSATLR